MDEFLERLNDRYELLGKWLWLLEQVAQDAPLTAQALARLDPEDGLGWAEGIASDAVAREAVEAAMGRLGDREAGG